MDVQPLAANAAVMYASRADEWAHTLTISELWRQMQRVRLWFNVAAFAAFIASSFFVVGFFAGSLHPLSWTMEQFLHGVVLALPFTATLTAFQYFLYSRGRQSAGWASLIAVGVAVSFGLMTEVGQGMERQENRVYERSAQSPVLQSALKAIETSAQSARVGVGYADTQAAAKLAEHTFELGRCNRWLKTHGQRRMDKCVTYEKKKMAHYQAIVDADRENRSQRLSAQSGVTSELIQSAKQLERDERHYHAFIRFLHDTLGVGSFLSANFILSLLLVFAFEYAFHYLGGFKRDTEIALRLRGYEVSQNISRPFLMKEADRPPLKRTAQNLYMPQQQVGFAPGGGLTASDSSLASPAEHVKSDQLKSPATPPARQAKPTWWATLFPAAVSRLQAAPTTPKPITPSASGLGWLKRALGSLGTPANTVPDRIGTPSDTSDSVRKSAGKSAGKNSAEKCTRTPSDTSQSVEKSGGNSALESVGKSVGQTPRKSVGKKRTGECTRTPPDTSKVAGLASLQAAMDRLPDTLKEAVDALYWDWLTDVLKGRIKPTVRPAKDLINKRLCRGGQRMTVTPSQMDVICAVWLQRAFQEKAILRNTQQGRGHPKFKVNPKRQIAE